MPNRPSKGKERKQAPASQRPQTSDNTARKKAQQLQSTFSRTQDNVGFDAERPFIRPIKEDLCVLSNEAVQPAGRPALTVPRRPKWRRDQTKESVEKNEVHLHEQWLRKTQAAVNPVVTSATYEDEEDHAEQLTGPHSVFETNLSVWRQLWRVGEMSDILLILIDARCPPIHYPPSLRDYLRNGIKPRKKILLVLTKTDLVGDIVARRWKAWLEAQEAAEVAEERFRARVVLIQSYEEQSRSILEQGTRMKYKPGQPIEQRHALIDAIQLLYDEICAPPPSFQENPAKLAQWRPRVSPGIDIEALKAGPAPRMPQKPIQKQEVTLGKAEAKKARKIGRREDLEHKQQQSSSKPVSEDDEEHDSDVGQDNENQEGYKGHRIPNYLTIGTIGHPNAGKSSLINCLLGRKAVRASATPGKTKAFQTHFLSPSVRLCDCPGLVMPSYTDNIVQLFAGMVQTTKSQAVIAYAADRIPIENLLPVSLPPPPPPSKIPGARPLQKPITEWNTDLLLVRYAEASGFITAKAARPDTYRAGAMIMRFLQSGAIRWAFRPDDGGEQWPDCEGLLLKDQQSELVATEEEEEGHTHQETAQDSSEEVSEFSSEEEEGEAEEPVTSRSAFAMLQDDLASDSDQSSET